MDHTSRYFVAQIGVDPGDDPPTTVWAGRSQKNPPPAAVNGFDEQPRSLMSRVRLLRMSSCTIWLSDVY